MTKRKVQPGEVVEVNPQPAVEPAATVEVDPEPVVKVNPLPEGDPAVRCRGSWAAVRTLEVGGDVAAVTVNGTALDESEWSVCDGLLTLTGEAPHGVARVAVWLA